MKTKYEYDVVSETDKGATVFVALSREQARQIKRDLNQGNRKSKIIQRKFILESQKEIR